MSRVGKIPVQIPNNVTVSLDDQILSVKGPKGQLSQKVDKDINVEIVDNQIIFSNDKTDRRTKALHGLYRNLASNMIEGLTNGYTKKLEVIGVGFDAELRGKGLYLELGLSHSVFFKPPDSIEFEVEKPKMKVTAPGTVNQYLIATISVIGYDKELVGQVASKIRSFRKPDVYKSKGIRYFGERIHLKPGKAGG